ncbi:MAG TPA: PHB depolymerase family esterase, partial [Rudaea sp.]
MPSALAIEPGHDEEVTFDAYTDAAGNSELARRMLTPLTAEQVAQRVAATGVRVTDQAIDLTSERFRIYVPRRQPERGYGVLVFISPFDDDRVPRGWSEVLDAHGMIFVSAARSGNRESPLGRREPLALLAAHNVLQRYRVDRGRVAIGGLSGGARIAMRLALAYPDLFGAALLDAGSDPLGGLEIPIPPRALFERFRRQSKIVYLTGSRDDANMSLAHESIASMRHWCVANVVAQTIVGLGHAYAPASAFSQALDAIDDARREAPDPDC